MKIISNYKFLIFSFLICVLLAGQGIHLKAQTPTFKEWVQTLSERPLLRPVERVYLQTDKPYYSVGDDIWFKGYVTIGQYQLLSALSQILYVDLLDSRDSIIQSLRLPLIAGTAMGDFKLTDSLAEGNYRLQAYTKWMKNFGPEGFYERHIPIGNTHPSNIIVDTQFVPKSGRSGWEAELILQSINGSALASKNIDYSIELPGKKTTFGKGVTDMQGLFRFDLPLDQLKGPHLGHMTLQIHQDQHLALRKQVPIKTDHGPPHIEFLPESGSMFDGYQSKIGVKALASSGKGMGAKGRIFDQDGEEVASFSTAHAGMGAFMFTPQKGKRYHALVTYSNGVEQKVSLPEVAKSGYALQINTLSQPNIFVQAYVSPDLIKDQNLYLVVQQHGAVAYASQFKVNKSEQTFSIPRDQMSAGVYQVTLFGENLQPLAERMIFHYSPEDQLNLEIQTDKEIYQTREKVDVNLTVGDHSDTTRVALLSASVIDIDQVPLEYINEKGIFDMLLLHPEIRGYLEDPTYYFTPYTIEKMMHLDHLMLTQAWRKIDWNTYAKSKDNGLPYEVEESIQFKGIVYDASGRKPEKEAKISLFQLNVDQGIILETTSDDRGRFSFERLIYTNEQRFFLQAESASGKRNVVLSLNEVEGVDMKSNKNSSDVEVNIHKQFSTYLKHNEDRLQDLEDHGLYERSILLESVAIQSPIKTKKVTRSANMNGPGVADQILVANDLSNCVNLVDCLNGRLTGVRFEGNTPISTRGGGSLLVIIDGLQLTGGDNSLLSSLSMLEVESIEVLRNVGTTAIYGPKGVNGVLIITTKIGGSTQVASMQPNTVIHRSNGYHQIRSFYVPNYSVKNEDDSRKDLRNTIHWEPNLITNKEGKAHFSFFTADLTGTYRILIEGMDTHGRMIRSLHTLRVQ
jgi:hypothetical protein